MTKPSEFRMLLPLENPISVYPALAKKLGLNEAIVLQQVHYWLVQNENKKSHIIDGRVWTYNTIEEWQATFSWWSPKTIIRIFTSLVELNLITKAKLSKSKQDHTTYYSINYDVFIALFDKNVDLINKIRFTQNDQFDMVKMTNSNGQNDQKEMVKMTNSITTETNTETSCREKEKTSPEKTDLWPGLQNLSSLINKPIIPKTWIQDLLELIDKNKDLEPFTQFLKDRKQNIDLDFASQFLQNKTYTSDCYQHYKNLERRANQASQTPINTIQIADNQPPKQKIGIGTEYIPHKNYKNLIKNQDKYFTYAQ